jgi:hypothetical protein
MTGQRAFARDHTVDTLHAIVHDDPPDLLSRGSALTTIVKRLAKAPEDRFQSAADLLWALQQIDPLEVRSELPRSSSQVPRGRRRFLRPRRGWAIAGIASVALVLAAGFGWWLRERVQRRSIEPDLTQFTWSIPEGMGIDSAPVVSPDGRRIAFTAVSSGSPSRLFVRSLDAVNAMAVAGTEEAKQPTFLRKRAGPRCSFGRCWARRDDSWPPIAVEANRSGAAMAASCSTSISKVAFVADLWGARLERSVRPSC